MLQFKSNCCCTRDQTPWRHWRGTNGIFRNIRSLSKSPFLSREKGLGIALVAAQKAGVPVTLVDTNQASIDKGLKFAGEWSDPVLPFSHL